MDVGIFLNLEVSEIKDLPKEEQDRVLAVLAKDSLLRAEQNNKGKEVEDEWFFRQYC